MEKTGSQSRREFFAHVTALGVAGLAGGGLDFAANSLDLAGPGSGVRLDRLRPEDFASHVGQTFTIHVSERRLDAELIKVDPRRAGSGAGIARPQFSVIFRLRGDEPLPHQIYSVEHAAMGRFDLFLGAVGQPCRSWSHLAAIFA